MWPFRKKIDAPPAPKREPDRLELFASDDLLKRAENIVYFVGYRGAVGGFVLEVYRLLKAYEALDQKSQKQPTP